MRAGEFCVVTRIPTCDLCQDGTPGPYDFKTRTGPWAHGCKDHWEELRVGPLGTGSGQLWLTQEEYERLWDDGAVPRTGGD